MSDMMNDPKFILIFDGDNTLWDTNAIFLTSQIAMLKPFEKLGFFIRADDKVSDLRAMDRLLIQYLKVYEYDFRLLSKSLLFHFSEKLDFESSVRKALFDQESYLDTSNQKIVEASFKMYTSTLTKIPTLLPNVLKVLDYIKELKKFYSNVVTILFSEGNLDRLDKIIDAYDFRTQSYFNDFMVASKEKESFQQANLLAYKYLDFWRNDKVITLVIGDSLMRDIAPANEAGFSTIYIPSKFQGLEFPKNEHEIPTYQIEQISQLPGILEEIGLSLPVQARW